MPAVLELPHSAGHVAMCGLRLERLLSAELFLESMAWREGRITENLATACQERWTDLAASVTASPEPLEGLLVLAASPSSEPSAMELLVAFTSIGRGATPAEARSKVLGSLPALRALVVTTLDYGEFRTIEDEGALRRILEATGGVRAKELRRRYEPVPIGRGVLERTILGFLSESDPAARTHRANEEVAIRTLFPWVPSNDTWRRLLELLLGEIGPCALVIHFRGFREVPAVLRDEAAAALAAVEGLASGPAEPVAGPREIFCQAADALRLAAVRRVAFTRGGMLAARVFLATPGDPSPALVAIVQHSLDDASVAPEQIPLMALFRGGAKVESVPREEIFASLDHPGLDELFGPAEAGAVLRTPMPVELDLPGLGTNRARTARFIGRSGKDTPLGVSVHRDERQLVALDDVTRFRHTYIIGQTGTGKSTLLLNMILHDIQRGRGVGVLDPHGSLIRDILPAIPEGRCGDVVLVDATDIEYPIGFNVLRIEEQDPLRYRMQRDLLIDDLQAYLERTFLREHMGPMFESHLRNLLALLLGDSPQRAPLIPNLMVFRALYSNARLRGEICRAMQGRDPVLDDFIAEALATTGEHSFRNLAPYVTSKFNRFVSDLALRNMTCQHRVLDLGEIVNRGGILLFYLGKGRFGDQAAGLLASQIVSRIRMEIMRRGSGLGAHPFYLYADEFHLFADERFGELLAEARKFGLALTLAHQFVRQLPGPVSEAILGNVGTIVTFRVGGSDAEALEEVYSPTFRKRDLMALPNFRA